MSDDSSGETVEQRLESLADRVDTLESGVTSDKPDIGIIETGSSSSKRERITATKQAIEFAAAHGDDEDGADIEAVRSLLSVVGFGSQDVDETIERLRRTGEVYEPAVGCLRVT